MPEYAELNAQASQVTLKRLDLAFQHFFRRVRDGETPGYPRFKSIKRFPGWGFKTHGDGFTFQPGAGWKGGTVRLAGIGKPKSTNALRPFGLSRRAAAAGSGRRARSSRRK